MIAKPSRTVGKGKEPAMSLREQQLAVTRKRIVAALGELIETNHPLDITMTSVAEQAGVSEPTLYRHFPTKRDLFTALGSELYRRTTSGVAPSSLDELVAFLPALYESFAAMEAVTRWNLVAPKGEAVRPGVEERLPILRKALGDALADLPEAEAQHMLRVSLLLTSPTCLLYWQDYLGVSVEEAAETAAWLARQIAKR